MIRVLLAEDQAMVREALATLLDLEDDITVVVQVSSGRPVVDAAREHAVDVALLDIEMPGMDGLTAAERLHAEVPGCRIVVLTTFGRPGFLRRAMEAGASGFLVKDSPARTLAAAIRRVVAGEQVIDPALAAAALAEPNPLSAREREVLLTAGDGAQIADIAERLRLSHGTVRNHLSNCIRKTGARTRSEAVNVAREKGWL